MLVVVREHREKLGDVRVEEGEAVGRWLGVVSRAVVGAVREGEAGEGERERGEDADLDVGDWNVVQNNGGRPKGQNGHTGLRGLTFIFYRSTRGPYVYFGAVFSCLVMRLSRQACFGSRKTFLLQTPVLHLLFLARVKSADSEICVEVVPHVHFHIIPRVGDVPEVKARSWTVFGKGQREELDEDDAVVLVGRMRERVRKEVERVRWREGEEGVRRLLGDGQAVGGVGGRGDEGELWRGTGRRSKL